MIGDDGAPTFFSIDENSGQIKLKASLADDTALRYKVSLFQSSIFLFTLLYVGEGAPR